MADDKVALQIDDAHDSDVGPGGHHWLGVFWAPDDLVALRVLFTWVPPIKSSIFFVFLFVFFPFFCLLLLTLLYR